jgi:hypothetical protein
MKRTVIVHLKDITLPLSHFDSQEEANADYIKEQFIEAFMNKFTTVEEAKTGIDIDKTTVLPFGVLLKKTCIQDALFEQFTMKSGLSRIYVKPQAWRVRKNLSLSYYQGTACGTTR